MLSMTFVFWALVGLFALVGAMRGWAKEILVTFTVILALFIYSIAITYLGPIKQLLAPPISSTEFWILTFFFVVLVMFGYQTPVLTRFASGKLRRERFTDAFLGFFLGAFNGYLIVGTIWYFMALANYQLPGVVPPSPIPLIVQYLPPEWLTVPWVFLAVIISFLFVIIVFI